MDKYSEAQLGRTTPTVRLPAQGRGRLRRGYTLIEIMVVAAISLLLMTIVAFIYNSALKVYEETQGLALVYETAKLINSDLRNYLTYVVPVPGNWIDPKTYSFPGRPNATATDIDPWYLDAGAGAGSYSNGPTAKSGGSGYMDNSPPFSGPNLMAADLFFSSSQYPNNMYNTDWYTNQASKGADRGNGYAANGWAWANWNATPPYHWANYNASNWSGVPELGTYRGYWMPAFYGRRKPGSVNPPDAVMACNDVNAGSWGWPRADYRIDVDIDNKAGGYRNKVPLAPGGSPVISCWFYAENRNFNSPRTMALDNSNIVLVSIKFSYNLPVPGLAISPTVNLPPIPEQTQLSILRHSIVGLDLPTQGLLRSDETTGSMIRAIKITPYSFDTGSNRLVPMNDADLNSSLDTGADMTGSVVQQKPPAMNAISQTPGFKIPRAFDVEYVLRNPYTFSRYTFAMRIYCQIDPLAVPEN